MRIAQPNRPLTVAGIALGAVALAAMTGVAFSAWIENGAAIFMTYAEAGLAWCF
jgi:hypothetical protein